MALLADELSLLPGMSDTGRLGFAIQLKFRQVQGHYPESINEFPPGIVHAIACGDNVRPCSELRSRRFGNRRKRL